LNEAGGDIFHYSFNFMFTLCCILLSSPGSVVATIQLFFERSSPAADFFRVQLLRNEIVDEKLGPFKVDRYLYATHPGLREFSYL